MANGHGGVRANSGNKPKQDFEKTNTVFLSAVKQVKNVETDEEARIEIAKDAANTYSEDEVINIIKELFDSYASSYTNKAIKLFEEYKKK